MVCPHYNRNCSFVTVTKNLIILDNPLLEVILRFILKTLINVLDFIT